MIAAIAATLALGFAPTSALPIPPAGECALVEPVIERSEPTMLAADGEATSVLLIVVCSVRVPTPTASNPGATSVQQVLTVVPLEGDDYQLIADASLDIVEGGDVYLGVMP